MLTDIEVRNIERDLIETINLVGGIPKWGGVQCDKNDDIIKNIFSIKTYKELCETFDNLHIDDIYKRNYLTRKWFKIIISKVDEELLFDNGSKNAIWNLSAYDKSFDGTLCGVNVDLKSTIIPESLFRSEWWNPNTIINWFYSNQSKERRFGTNNRVFIVCGSENGEKSTDILQSSFTIKQSILKDFSENIGITIPWVHINFNGNNILSQVIYFWETKSNGVQYKFG